MKIGYGRTNTIHQEAGCEAQLRDLGEAGCEKVFQERVSAAGERMELTVKSSYNLSIVRRKLILTAS